MLPCFDFLGVTRLNRDVLHNFDQLMQFYDVIIFLLQHTPHTVTVIHIENVDKVRLLLISEHIFQLLKLILVSSSRVTFYPLIEKVIGFKSIIYLPISRCMMIILQL